MENRKFGAFSSSEDPEKLANTVKGAVLSFSAIILMIAQYFDIPLTDLDIVTFASQLGLAVGSLWAMYGVLLKVVAYFTKKD